MYEAYRSSQVRYIIYDIRGYWFISGEKLVTHGHLNLGARSSSVLVLTKQTTMEKNRWDLLIGLRRVEQLDIEEAPQAELQLDEPCEFSPPR